MRTVKKQFILFLIGFSTFSAYSQEAEQTEIQSTDSSASMEEMVRVVLGNLYAETGYLSEDTWLRMTPLAEEYIRGLLLSGETIDIEEANRISEEAWLIFDTKTKAMLDEEQIAAQAKWRADFEEESMQIIEFSTSPEVMDAVNQQRKTRGEGAKDGTVTINYD